MTGPGRALVGLAATGFVLSGAVGADTFYLSDTRISVGPNPSAIAAPDLNGDGLPEIITADLGRLSDPDEERPANDQLSYLVADEPLSYTVQPPLQADFGPYAITVANIDALKAPDLVVASFHATRGNPVTVFRNVGDNLLEPYAFPIAEQRLAYARMLDGDGRPVFTRPGLTAVAVRDLNGDTYRDIVATGWASDVLVLYPGIAEAPFFDAPRLIEAEGGPRDVALADFDEDGEVDAAVTMYSSGEVALWRGQGDLSFEPAGRFRTPGELPHKLKAADMDGDGHLDLVVSHRYVSDSVLVCYGDGDLGFGTLQEIPLGDDRDALEHEIRDIVVARFEEGAPPGIAAACYRSGRVIALLPEPDAAGPPLQFRRESYRMPRGRPRALCAADFNNDGKLDIGVALWESDAVAFLLAR